MVHVYGLTSIFLAAVAIIITLWIAVKTSEILDHIGKRTRRTQALISEVLEQIPKEHKEKAKAEITRSLQHTTGSYQIEVRNNIEKVLEDNAEQLPPSEAKKTAKRIVEKFPLFPDEIKRISDYDFIG